MKCDYLSAIVSGLSSGRRRTRLLVMLQAYIDDSGWDGTSPVFVLAGYVSTVEKWQSFSDEWQAVLDNPEPSRIPVFKMKEAAQLTNRNSPFYGWTEDQRDDRLIDLVKVVNRHAMHGIICVIPTEPYKRILAGQFEKDFDRPYFLSFMSILTNLLNLTNKLQLDDKIELIFDSDDHPKGFLTEQYEVCMSHAPEEVRKLSAGMPIFRSDDCVKPLQAADLLAWQARRYYFDLSKGQEPTESRWNVFFANLFRPEHDIFELYDEQKIREVAILLGRGRRVSQGIEMSVPNLATFRHF